MVGSNNGIEMYIGETEVCISGFYYWDCFRQVTILRIGYGFECV